MIDDRNPLLSVQDLRVEYRASGAGDSRLAAVRGVSLDVAPAEILALVGESGSGKTSLAQAVLQLQPAASGRVLFRGEDLARMDKKQLRETRRFVQAVFQDPLASLSPRRSVAQSLLEPLDHFQIGSRTERLDKASAALTSVGLETDLLKRFPHELSGGQRQRVALARALVTEPQLIIADEPLSSLDVTVGARIMRLMIELRDRLGIAFLFVTHDLSKVSQMADSVAVIYVCRLLECSPADQLFSAPAHPYTRSLLAAVPVADPGHPGPVVLKGEPPSALTPPAGCVFHMRCKDKIERCLSEEPQEQSLDGDGRHRVRCHLCNS